MYRFIIFIVLAYVAYRIVRAVIWPKDKITRGPEGGAIDEMVQDPFCKTYIPKREAVKRAIGGEIYCFCSEECAHKFESQRSA